MSNPLSNLEPKAVWDYFYQLTQVPRPSKHEEKVRKFLLDFGKNLGLEAFADEIGNVIIRKPATPGMENRRGVILQGHMDMVPQANSDVRHNWLSDPVQPRIDGEWVKATGTTLGADNGMGVATAMAILASKDIAHGPLEALFTCDEETGMTGANGIKSGILQGDMLINCDYEDEGELCVGCAGGINGSFTFDAKLKPAPEHHKAFKLSVTGLRGGHSGIDINLGRGNANKIIFRYLNGAMAKFGVRLVDIQGGSLRNAIPREAFATILVPDFYADKIAADVAEYEQIVKSELNTVDPDLRVSIEPVAMPEKTISDGVGSRLIKAVYACPNGVARMSTDVEGLVETSNNLAIVKLEGGKIQIKCLLRSSVETAKMALAEQIGCVFHLADADVVFDEGYPGWKPNMKSKILDVMRRTSVSVFGKEAEIKAVHAGLECGILGSKYPNWDMVACGPHLVHPHSPDEAVNIASVERFYRWIIETLKNIPEK